MGGLVGYIAYEFRVVITAIPKAWRAASNWRPNWQLIRQLIRGSLIFFVCLLGAWIMMSLNTMIFGAIFAALAVLMGSPAPPHGEAISFLLFLGIIMGFFFSPIPLLLLTKGGEITTESCLRAILYCNPIAIYIYWPIRGIIWAISRIPKVVLVLGRFFFHLFRLIHSERRLIAGTWAFLGVSAWLLAVPFWPCLIGSVLGGVVSVELIGKRLLKTLPAYNGA